MDINPDVYRPNVGIMLLNAQNQIWVGARIDYVSEYWQMPQGGVDDGEDMETAMWRELYEEIGVEKSHCQIINKTPDWIYYDLPENIAQKLWNGAYKGQKQIWYCLKLTASDTVINIDTEHPEFKAWKWLNPNALVDTIVPFKRDVYNQVLQHFQNHIT